MGNCLKGSSTDDLSPLRNAETTSENATSEQPWLPYREVNPSGPLFYPSPGISCSVNQLSEEDQVKIAKKLGFIQHRTLNAVSLRVFSVLHYFTEEELEQTKFRNEDIQYAYNIRLTKFTLK
ncbi:RING finger protein 11-like [Diaphorina citri]|uniref:RING finger protein 11-like n=1 Tax=Diaphorina citri TaxID=121845 RepID=A0A1S3DHY0_DIACI|nr:RING finger protein 11-like [Diaphorina citri]